MSFDRLLKKTRATRRHHDDETFLEMVGAVHELLAQFPRPFQYKLYPGSASWLGSEEDAGPWLGHSNDLTIWKLCFYGDDDYAFGVRRQFADQFDSLKSLRLWDRRFQVPPNYREDQWFVGFPVQADERSVERIAQVVQAVYDELTAKYA